jgi:hypothetical protein
MYQSAVQKFMQDLQINSHPREFFYKGVMVTQKDMKLLQTFIHSCGLIHVQGPRMQQYFFLFYFFLVYSHVHTLFWSFLHPAPLSLCPPEFQAGLILPLSLILLKKGYMHNKKDKEFLLVELRIAVQKESYNCFHVPMYYDSY